MTKSKKKKSRQDDKATRKKAETKATEQQQQQQAAAKAAARATAKFAALIAAAKKARASADTATRAAEQAGAATGAAQPQQQPDEAELLRLALRSTEARLTDAERKVEQLERQIADFHTLDDQVVDGIVQEAVVDAAVQATVEEAVLEAEIVAGSETSPAEEAEVIAEELDEIVAQAQPAALEAPSDGPGADAADAGSSSSGGAAADTAPEEPVSLTPPLPEQPADDEPNESWTLLKLRAEAKRRGLTGTSNLPKAALLDRLRG